MAIQTAPSATIIFFCLVAFTTLQASAFSTSSPCTKCERTQQQQQRIWASSDSVQQNSVRLFAEAGDSAVKAADKKDDEKKEAEIPTDPAKTTPEFLAGLWRLIAQGNDMVRGVSPVPWMLPALLQSFDIDDKTYVCLNRNHSLLVSSFFLSFSEPTIFLPTRLYYNRNNFFTVLFV